MRSPQVDKEKAKTMRLLRGYSKASLVEYLASTSVGWPCQMRWELLRLIELRNAGSEISCLTLQAVKLRTWLDRRHAIISDGDHIRFDGYGSRSRKKLLVVWNRFARLTRRISSLYSSAKALEALLEPNAPADRERASRDTVGRVVGGKVDQ
jgi:hypothetical protein